VLFFVVYESVDFTLSIFNFVISELLWSYGRLGD